MKKAITFILAGAVALVSTSCTTTYDAYGNPRQSVDPGTAAAGAAAAGVLGYTIANRRDRNKGYRHHHHHPQRGYYNRYGYPRY
jgi:hypothetical protein